MLEGNPITFPEVKTLLDGVTIGGRKITDQEQVINLIKSAKRVLALVKTSQFQLNKAIFTEIHALTASNEALPTAPGAPKLNQIFEEGLTALNTCTPFEKGLAFFLFGALQQFFFDGNKRTARFMMNGILMSAGIDAISVPAAKAQEFNEKMVEFYLTKDATEMMAFLVNCHPEAKPIQC